MYVLRAHGVSNVELGKWRIALGLSKARMQLRYRYSVRVRTGSGIMPVTTSAAGTECKKKAQESPIYQIQLGQVKECKVEKKNVRRLAGCGCSLSASSMFTRAFRDLRHAARLV